MWGSDFEPKLTAGDVEVGWSFHPGGFEDGSPCNTSELLSVNGACHTTHADGCFQSTPDWALCGEGERRSLPDVLRFRMNSTGLSSQDSSMQIPPRSIKNAARIFIGTESNFHPFASGTPAIHLFPGTHVSSVVRPMVRRRLKSSLLAYLGIDVSDDAIVVDEFYS